MPATSAAMVKLIPLNPAPSGIASAKDVCTGHFYTLAGCNPNGCGMPSHRREEFGKMMDRGMTDREIIDELLKEAGPLLLRPHLMP